MAQAAGYRTPRFLTFKQALELGGNVRKGERGSKVFLVKQLQVRDKGADDNFETRLVPMMREYTVFNVDQCENLPDSITKGKPMRVRNPDARDELADAFLHSTSADIREGHGEAYYVPSRDFISMPAFAGFKGADHFYNVVFHELTHWAGHKSRLDRDLKNRFGSRDYAAELIERKSTTTRPASARRRSFIRDIMCEVRLRTQMFIRRIFDDPRWELAND
jgi:antirestriction protein ArdC